VAADDEASRTARHDDQVGALTTQISSLDERLRDTEANLAAVTSQNERLADTLREARDQVVALKAEVDRLAQPPSGFGVFLAACDDNTADVFTGGRKMRVNVSPNVELDELRPGQEVVLNEALNVVIAQGYGTAGEVVMLKELLADGERALVISHADEERVVWLAEPLRNATLRAGDSLLLEPRSGYASERIHMAEEFIVEEMPDITYADIGGLEPQIEQIRNAVELPYLQHDLFKKIMLHSPKGVLLYGPSGCGKTLIAKALANSLAKLAAGQAGEEKSCFLNIKGPELLNKYVGETERHIRLAFQRAREQANEGIPVIVFFDEMDSIFRMRGQENSADFQNTTVPQLLSELDAVESLGNLIVIGASSREDMIDPAFLRPGRLDVKIRIDRPDAEAARDILAIYLPEDLPIHPDDLATHQGNVAAAISSMINRTVEYLYSEDKANQFFEVTYQSGDKEILYFRDFSSGATLANIVDRAKLAVISRSLNKETFGLRDQDLLAAAAEEIRAIEHLTRRISSDDWARISGRKGEQITFIRTLARRGDQFDGRAITLNSSTYAA
jgi:proteasome-associated ATPase